MSSNILSSKVISSFTLRSSNKVAKEEPLNNKNCDETRRRQDVLDLFAEDTWDEVSVKKETTNDTFDDNFVTSDSLGDPLFEQYEEELKNNLDIVKNEISSSQSSTLIEEKTDEKDSIKSCLLLEKLNKLKQFCQSSDSESSVSDHACVSPARTSQNKKRESSDSDIPYALPARTRQRHKSESSDSDPSYAPLMKKRRHKKRARWVEGFIQTSAANIASSRDREAIESFSTNAGTTRSEFSNTIGDRYETDSYSESVSDGEPTIDASTNKQYLNELNDHSYYQKSIDQNATVAEHDCSKPSRRRTSRPKQRNKYLDSNWLLAGENDKSEKQPIVKKRRKKEERKQILDGLKDLHNEIEQEKRDNFGRCYAKSRRKRGRRKQILGLDEFETKTLHNKNEQERREALKQAYENLRDVCELQEGSTKVLILSIAKSIIETLNIEDILLGQKIKLLKKEKEEKQVTLKTLATREDHPITRSRGKPK